MKCKQLTNFKNIIQPVFILPLLFFMIFATNITYAQTFGAGKFDANVPFGNQTSLSIATGGNVTINITPSGTSTLGTGNNAVTITSTDVVGYKLYLNAVSSTNLTKGANTIPASANVTPAALAVNTWGYNTDGSSNFTGITGTAALILSATGPFETGNLTTFTYGVKVDSSQTAGSYTTTVVYTAVPQSN